MHSTKTHQDPTRDAHRHLRKRNLPNPVSLLVPFPQKAQTSKKKEKKAHEKNKARQDARPAEHPDPPRKERLHDPGDDGAHDRDREPRVVELRERGALSVVVYEVVERKVGDQPRLDPFVHEDAVHCATRHRGTARAGEARSGG